jgi:hypothetical protein
VDASVVIPFKDAFIALASVSAVLWTGGLIVLQIRTMGNAKTTQDKINETKAAMACIAFGVLAPLFMLFLAGAEIRSAATAFFFLYALMTWQIIPFLARSLKDSARWQESINSIAFLLPTLALLVVAAFPLPVVVIWTSAFLVFLGYFLLSDSVNALGRD